LVSDNSAWGNLKTGAYCAYDNSSSNANTYGYLYNWYAVADPRGLCPTGWHVPSDSEWQQMINYLGGEATAGGKLKSTSYWKSPNEGASNSSGFSGFPGGWRNSSGTFRYITESGNWWSATEESAGYAWEYSLNYFNGKVNRDGNGKTYGLSVRCLRD
jgi:uncharacterized protein (TIGR02145 family)